jgi:ribA/ribD-fused uncharacterized protein
MRFRGKYHFLSNFFAAQVSLDGDYYDTVEHAFQAAKTRNLEERDWVRRAPSPAIAKARGRKVTLREDWEKVKDQVMLDLLRLKFREPELRQALLETGKTPIVEDNYWNDRYWGQVNGKGRNRLGELLMEVRTEALEADEEYEHKT